jgi:hypothetical protein
MRDNALGIPEELHQIRDEARTLDENVCDLQSFTEQLKEDLESRVNDRRGEIDELTQRLTTFEDETVDGIKDDKEEIKQNATYIEEHIIEGLKGDTFGLNEELNQLRNDIIQLKVDVKKPPTLPYQLNANGNLVVQMLWEKWMQSIYFLFATIHYGEHPIDFNALTSECQNPDGDVGQAWSAWIVTLRSAKTNW